MLRLVLGVGIRRGGGRLLCGMVCRRLGSSIGCVMTMMMMMMLYGFVYHCNAS